MNIDNITEELGDSKLMAMNDIIRYITRPKIKQEGIAAHSFFVTTTVLKICDMLEVDTQTRLEALEFAVVHDIPELWTSDIPYDIKESFPDIKESLQRAELSLLGKNAPEYLNTYIRLLKAKESNSISYLILNVADMISVLQYTNREIELGNNAKITLEINKESENIVKRRLEKLKNKLK